MAGEGQGNGCSKQGRAGLTVHPFLHWHQFARIRELPCSATRRCILADCLSPASTQFFGFSLASAYASYYLLQEYKLATSLLQGSVEELGESTSKVRHLTTQPALPARRPS